MWFIYPLLGGLLSIAGSMAGRVLLAIGISFVTFQGYDLAIIWLLNYVKSSLSSMPSEVVGFLGYLWVDKAIGMIFSAYTAATVIKVAGGTGMTKMVTKGIK